MALSSSLRHFACHPFFTLILHSSPIRHLLPRYISNPNRLRKVPHGRGVGIRAIRRSHLAFCSYIGHSLRRDILFFSFALLFIVRWDDCLGSWMGIFLLFIHFLMKCSAHHVLRFKEYEHSAFCVCVCVCVYRSQIKSGQNPVQLVSAVAVSAFFITFSWNVLGCAE